VAGSVPFSYIGSGGNLVNVTGILRLENDDLFLSFRKADPFMLGRKLPLKEVRIPLTQVDALEFLNNRILFHVRLRLRVRKLEFLDPVPGSDGAEIVLWCRRRYRPIANELANLVTIQILERVFPDEKHSAGA
jgi:hypothetical protein